MELYNLEHMKNERRLIIEFCKDQIRATEHLKNQLEHSSWNDARKDELIEHMNAFSHNLAATLTVLYQVDTQKVNFFDDLIPRLEAYLDTASAFDSI